MKYVINKSSKKWHRAIAVIGGGLLVLLIAILVALNSWYHENLQPLTAESNEKIIVIELGSSTLQIARQLEDEPLIKSARAFSWYVSRLGGDQVIQAGTYRLDSDMGVPEIVDILVQGKVDTSLVTILSGLRLDQIRQVLINAGFSKEDANTALGQRYDHPIYRYLPDGETLEGYIYPETYQITSESNPQTIVIAALDQLHAQLTPGLLDNIKKQGLTVHEAIILASIVQKESRDFEDQRKVAQVFLKRLEIGMPLGADATFRYAAAVTGQEPSVDLKSPYNTRIHEGLTPGPISNFHINALLAVADPADTDYLYFLHGDDCLEEDGVCTTYFANTLSEHESNAAKYCRKNCQL